MDILYYAYPRLSISGRGFGAAQAPKGGMMMKKRLTGILLLVLILAGMWLSVSRMSAVPPGEAETGTSSEPEPTPAPEPTNTDIAMQLLSSMTPEQRVWQMLYVFPQAVSGSNTDADAELWAEKMAERPAGGFVINSENMASAEQLRALTASIKSSADICPFIGVDEEGGQVARLAFTLGVTTDFKAMYTYREGGEAEARANAAVIGGDIASFGFNQDFAPVADVWTNEKNTVIGKRAYSDDPDEAAALVSAAVEGFKSQNIITTLKHFPGHGDTEGDSHYAAVHSAKTLDELRQCEFKPFVSGIAAGAGMVMTGHITLDEIDPGVPATLSEKVVTDLLRGELGWDGVVITDSFIMAAIAQNYDETDAAVMAVNAGCDIILGPGDPDAVAAALLERVDPARIDESVLRILILKLESGLI